jgi:hypothetical protein
MKALVGLLLRRQRLPVVFALAFFVLAQLGAELHSYAHDAAALGGTAQTITIGHSLCDECLAYAPLLSATSSAARLPPLPGPPRPFVAAPDFVSFVDHSPILAFRSRAPPRATPA